MLLIPIGTAERPRRQPLATFSLILFTIAAYLASRWSGLPQDQVLDRWGFIANECSPATFLTSMFLHRHLWLLIVNMWLLFVFGPLIESRLSHLPFGLLYVAGGLASAAVAAGLDQGSDRMLANVGSSGALGAILGAFVVLYPFTDIRIWYVWFLTYWGFKMGIVRVMGLLVIVLWFLGQLFALWLESLSGKRSVDMLLPFGGFLFGVIASVVGFGKEGVRRETSYED